MKIVLDDNDVPVVEIDFAYLCSATARPWAKWVLAPTKDQALILGIGYPLQKGWAQLLIGETISVGMAKALIALGDRRTAEAAKKRKGLTSPKP